MNFGGKLSWELRGSIDRKWSNVLDGARKIPAVEKLQYANRNTADFLTQDEKEFIMFKYIETGGYYTYNMTFINTIIVDFNNKVDEVFLS